MKNRLIKTTILIAVSTLVMLNIQLLFDTTSSPFLMGATAQTTEENRNFTDLENHMLIIKWCPLIKFDIDLDWDFQSPKWYIPDITFEGEFDLRGHKHVCEEVGRNIWCDVTKLEECKEGSVKEHENAESEISQ